MKLKLLSVVLAIAVLIGFGVWMLVMSNRGSVNSVGDYSNLIHVDSPTANAVVSSPLMVTGQARGTWYFEASFPVRLIDANGKELGVIPAQAQSDWMTENFVPFKAMLTFSQPTTKTGTLILHNDNPSGLAEKSKEVRIPVRFSDTPVIQSAEFNKSITMRVGDKVIFSDSLLLSVKEINDSRCKPGVQCVWQGELSTALTLLNGKTGASPLEIRLGTVNNKSVSGAYGYVFSLESATESSVTIIVSVATASGGVSGYIHMGPTCPVERNPPDPNCADRAYANAEVYIQVKGSSGAFMTNFTSDTNGNFHANLAAGTYVITVASQTNGILPRCGEREVIVTASKFTNVDISCDTGIR